MAIQRTRLRNLRWLMEKLNVDSHEIAEKWGTSEQYLNQMLGGKHAKIGINIATRIEKAEKLPMGWLSTQHKELRLGNSEEAYNDILKLIHQLDITHKTELMVELSKAIDEEVEKLDIY